MAQAVKVDAKVAFDGVSKALEEIVPGIMQQLGEIKLAQMQRLAEKVKAVAPRRTGKYANAIRAAYLSDYPAAVARSQAGAGKTTGARLPVRGASSVDEAAVGLFAPYIWAWLEFGTVRSTRKPHIYPTYRAWKPLMRRAMTTAVNKAVKKAVADGNAKTNAVAGASAQRAGELA